MVSPNSFKVKIVSILANIFISRFLIMYYTYHSKLKFIYKLSHFVSQQISLKGFYAQSCTARSSYLSERGNLHLALTIFPIILNASLPSHLYDKIFISLHHSLRSILKRISCILILMLLINYFCIKLCISKCFQY